jgi:hypothetical protein
MTRRGLLALCIVVLVSFAGVQKPAVEIEDQYFDSNGVKIRYIDVGQGEPIVLIHAFGATLDLNWRRPGSSPPCRRSIASSRSIAAVTAGAKSRTTRRATAPTWPVTS